MSIDESQKAHACTNLNGSLHPSIETMELGVWRVFLAKKTLFSFNARREAVKIMYPTILKLTLDFYAIAPWRFPLLCACTMFEPVAQVIMWHYFNSSVVSIIEAGLTQGKVNITGIAVVLAIRVAFTALMGVSSWWRNKMESVVQNRMIGHFDEMLFKWQARSDLRTSKENMDNIDDITSASVWYSYRRIIYAAAQLLSIVWQLCYVGALVSTSREGAIYTLLFLVKPFMKEFLNDSMWQRSWICESRDPNFNRMQSLNAIVSEYEYKQSVISNNLTEYLVQEYSKARKALGDKSASYPATQYQERERLGLVVASDILGDLHTIYRYISVVLHPSKFTLSTITMLPEAGTMISKNLEEVLTSLQLAEAELSSITRIYNLMNVRNTVVDGGLDAHGFVEPGVSLEMKNVTFTYPGSESPKNVLTDVSFCIPAGNLVVIVGPNGSGKSTLLKLLTRLYDRTSGEVLINERDIRKYKLSDLQAATAVLTQDHYIYPLSLAENIGIGNPAQVSNEEEIQVAAKKGGADGLIKKCSEGLSTVLVPKAVHHWDENFCPTEDTPLAKKFREFKQDREVSGGEKQRLVAARTFMRLTSKEIKLVIADEPSSNLDPEGEAELFANLIKETERKERTMLCVTHRFGPLVKHADLILCMQDGRLVEQGKHEALMEMKGVYAEMYNTQARPFAT